MIAAALLAVFQEPNPRIPAGVWAGVLREHPRLLGPGAHLRALAEAKREAYDEVRRGDWIEAVGIAHAVDGVPRERIEPFLAAARRDVERGVTNDHQETWVRLTEVVLAYDLFFDAVDAAERARWIEWMNGHLARFTTDEGAFHNSTLSKILCYLRIAYGTWGENPRAREFRDHAIETLYRAKVAPVLREFGAGGGFTEAGWYARGSLWNLVQALELARRIEGYDGFAEAPRFFYERLAYEMFQPYPGLWEYGSERYPVEGDGSHVYGGHNEYPRHMRTVLAQYFRGSELARAVANRRRRGSNPQSRLVDFLWEEEPDGALDLSRFPLAHLARGIGKVYARSDWTDDATWLRFECGDYWAGHQHFEVGNFEVFRYEPLATESGEYHDYLSNHSVNWLLRTVAHNSILVYEPGETWTQLRDGGRNSYANDGGQTKSWEWTVDNLDEWSLRRETFERGDIVAYENRPEYLFVAGDCTRAYAPSKMASFVRQIVFLRPHTIVIYDQVASTRADFEKTWLLYTRNEPAIDGATFTVADGRGRLVVRALLPEEPRIRAVHGYTYGGQTFDPPQNVLSAAAARWRVEVQPTEPSREDAFLHVLFTDEPEPTEIVRRRGTVGVRVGGAEVVFDGRVGGRLTVGTRRYHLEAQVKPGPYE